MPDLSHQTATTFSGTTLRASDPAYDEARTVFNGMIDRRPDRIMRCTRRRTWSQPWRRPGASGLPLSGVRRWAQRHRARPSSTAGSASTCAASTRSRSTRRRGRPGSVAAPRWGAVDAATQEHGLAVTGGRVSTTGIGGLALGLGQRVARARARLHLRQPASARRSSPPTGASSPRRANEHPDLFWALRGGGGNFGIVTEFTLRLHPVGPIVLGGMLLYPAADGGRPAALLA